MLAVKKPKTANIQGGREGKNRIFANELKKRTYSILCRSSKKEEEEGKIRQKNFLVFRVFSVSPSPNLRKVLPRERGRRKGRSRQKKEREAVERGKNLLGFNMEEYYRCTYSYSDQLISTYTFLICN